MFIICIFFIKEIYTNKLHCPHILLVKYICSGTCKILQANTTSWKTDALLTLVPGGQYYIQMAALNGAGLTAVHNTNGVTVDPTPPMVYFNLVATSIMWVNI